MNSQKNHSCENFLFLHYEILWYPLSEAITDLKKRGYVEDFNLKKHCLECPSLNIELHPENFTVDEFHRFEGMSNPDDNSIVFAISSNEGIKGTFVDAYGMYADSLTESMIKKLTIHRE